jgi:hypothetical protein
VDIVDLLLVENNLRNMLAGTTLFTHGHSNIGKHEGKCVIECPYCGKKSVGANLWNTIEKEPVLWTHPQKAFDRVVDQMTMMDNFADEFNEYEIMRLERSCMPADIPDIQ